MNSRTRSRYIAYCITSFLLFLAVVIVGILISACAPAEADDDTDILCDEQAGIERCYDSYAQVMCYSTGSDKGGMSCLVRGYADVPPHLGGAQD